MTRLARLGVLVPMLWAVAAAVYAEAGTRVWRGNFAIGRQGAVFSPCLSGRRLAVDDATGGALARAYREFAPAPGKPIFVEMSGALAAERVRAVALHRAYRDGPGCRENLDAVRLVALGSEPLWRLEAGGDGVRLRLQGEPAMREYPPGGFALRDGERRYEGASRASVLQLVVRRAACRDALSGAYFDHTVEARVDATLLRGCAYWGNLERPDDAP